jgi:peptidoglycan hydrolase-like protein with peptidoglycan-binding domain
MTTAQDVEKVMRAEVGYVESPAGSNRNKFGAWYGMDGVPWCAIFASWGLYTAFHAHGGHSPVEGVQSPLGFSFCDTVVAWAKGRGLWRSTPSYGSLVLYDWNASTEAPGGAQADHVGWVASVGSADPAAFTAIEGNTSSGSNSNGGQVMVCSRRNDRGYCLGFVQLPYTAASPTPAPAPATPAAPQWPGRVFSLTSPLTHGTDVTTWQRQMIVRGVRQVVVAGVSKTFTADGYYGPVSSAACRALQLQKNLVVDGVVGPATWLATWQI